MDASHVLFTVYITDIESSVNCSKDYLKVCVLITKHHIYNLVASLGQTEGTATQFVLTILVVVFLSNMFVVILDVAILYR